MNEVALFTQSRDVVNHIAILNRIAKADGVVLEQEQRFIRGIAEVYLNSVCQMTSDELMRLVENVSVEELELWRRSLRDNQIAARNLLKDMITLGHIDGDFCLAERDYVIQSAVDFGVDKSFVDEMSDVICLIMTNTKRLEQLIFEIR